MARIKVKLSDGRIGTLEENEFDPRSMTRVDAPAAAPEKAVLEGNLQSSKLFGGNDLIGNILNAIASPAVATGQTIGGGLYELGRAGLGLVDKRVYDAPNQTNPFLSKEKLTKIDKEPGAFVGDQVKESLALAALGIPIGGASSIGGKAIAPGVFKGGALAGAGLSLPEAQSASDVGLGAVTGGVGAKFLNKILGGGKSLQGVKEGIEKGIARPKVPASATMADAENKLMQEGRGIGKEFGVDIFGGPATKQKDNLSTIYKKVQASIDDYIANSETKVPNARNKIIRSVKKDGANFVPDDPQYKKLGDRELKLLEKTIGDGSLKNLDKAKSEIAKRAGDNAFRKMKGELNSALTPQEAVRYDIWKALDNIIKNSDKGLKELRLKQSTLHQLAPGIDDSASRNLTLSPLGIPTGVNLNQPIQALQSGAAKTAGGAGKFMNAITSPFQQGIGKEALLKSPAVMQAMSGSTPQPTEVIAEEAMPQEEAVAGESKAQKIQKALAMAMMMDLASGGKNVAELNTIAAVLEKLGGTGETTAQKAAITQAEEALSLVDTIEGQFGMVQDQGLAADSPGLGLLGGLKGSVASLSQSSPQAASYERVKKAFLSKLARASGEKGVLTDQDVKRIEDALPSFYDTPETAAENLRLVREIIGTAIKGTQQ